MYFIQISKLTLAPTGKSASVVVPLSDRKHINSMILTVVFFATVVFTYCVRKWFTVWQYSEKFPGPTWWPIVGNAVQMGSNSYGMLLVT